MAIEDIGKNALQVLEKRYLCFLTWEQIAVDMGYDLRWLYRLQRRALSEVRVPSAATRHEKPL